MAATGVELGYALSSEEHTPLALVEHAARAEECGFTYALVSDHFHPWIDAQGQSPFVWSVLGGIATRTERLRVGTERVPFCIGHGARQAERGENDRPARHLRHSGKQCGDCGRSSGDPGGDRKAFRRRIDPTLSGRAQQGIAAGGQIDPPLGGERCRPLVEDRAEAVERQLPMRRELRSAIV